MPSVRAKGTVSLFYILTASKPRARLSHTLRASHAMAMPYAKPYAMPYPKPCCMHAKPSGLHRENRHCAPAPSSPSIARHAQRPSKARFSPVKATKSARLGQPIGQPQKRAVAPLFKPRLPCTKTVQKPRLTVWFEVCYHSARPRPRLAH